MLKGFKQFILRGNVVDLAVGVVMGAAFGGVVGAFVKDLLTPLISAIFGKPNFEALSITVNNATFAYGDFLNVLISFVLIALAVYFFVVTPVNAMITRYRQEPTPDPTTRKCPECLSEVAIQARRCAFCTSAIPPVG